MRNKNILAKYKHEPHSFSIKQTNASFSFHSIQQLLDELNKDLKSKDLITLSFSEKETLKTKIFHVVNFILCEIEKALSSQLNSILTHPRFEQLEASWRGLNYLVESTLPTSEVKIRVLNITWDIISKDLSQALEFDQSQIFKKIYEEEFGIPGGEPYGLLVGDYSLALTTSAKKRKSDLDTLKALSGIAAASFAPFITSVTPESFGLQSFEDLSLLKNMDDVFNQGEYEEWNRFREEEDSRFVGLVIPNILIRQPYKTSGISLFGNNSDNLNGPYEQNHYLWGNASYCFASLAISTFLQSGWFFSMRGFAEDTIDAGMVEGVCKASYEVETPPVLYKPIVNILITSQRAREIEECGFLTICALKNLPVGAFLCCPSVQKPKLYNREPAVLNARLSIMLNDMLSVSRFAHYIKVLIRDKLGRFTSPQEIEAFLQQWLLQYTAANDMLTPALLVKYPLKAFQLMVNEVHGEPTNYMCVVQLQPQSEIDELSINLRIRFNIKN